MIVPIWKQKGDVHDSGKYCGITLLTGDRFLSFWRGFWI